MSMANLKTGTREWSDTSFNCVKGCAHGCLYCYARAARFNSKRGAAWVNEELTFPQVKRKPGVVMFPTQHDFTPNTLEHCIVHLAYLLEARNNVLVVTKTGLDTVGRMFDVLKRFPREQSEIRFTLSHYGAAVGNFWEPHAPPIKDRLDGLALAKALGVRTSVSCEPWLDSLEALIDTVAAVSPSVTETIWIGHANKLRSRTLWTDKVYPADVGKIQAAIDIIEARQTPDAARAVYDALKGNPKVRWKDSYQKMLGLPSALSTITNPVPKGLERTNNNGRK